MLFLGRIFKTNYLILLDPSPAYEKLRFVDATNERLEVRLSFFYN